MQRGGNARKRGGGRCGMVMMMMMMVVVVMVMVMMVMMVMVMMKMMIRMVLVMMMMMATTVMTMMRDKDHTALSPCLGVRSGQSLAPRGTQHPVALDGLRSGCSLPQRGPHCTVPLARPCVRTRTERCQRGRETRKHLETVERDGASKPWQPWEPSCKRVAGVAKRENGGENTRQAWQSVKTVRFLELLKFESSKS